MCSTSLRDLASDEVYSNVLHVLTIIEISAHFFGAYVIASKTPKKLESVRASMLYLHLVGAFVDVYFSLLTMPVLHLPICGGHPLGILSFFGVPTSLQVYVGVSLFGVIAVTILIFLEDRRYRLVHGHKTCTRRKWCRLLFVIALYSLAAALPTPVFLHLPDQETGKLKNQCIPRDLINHPNFFLLDDGGYYIVICAMFTIVFIGFQILLQVGLICRELFKHSHVSKSTHRLQKQFFIAMSLQIVIPLLVLVFPVLYFAFSVSSNYYNQGANNLAFLIVSLHGVTTTLMMLMVHTPYRNSIFEMLNLKSANQSGDHTRRIWKISSLESHQRI
nr:hypothetical protein C31B8.3 - Caenorhabditis elegans [Caenorhabditis elegans]